MSKLVKYIDKKFYPDYQDNWDDKIFARTISKHINADSVLLDIGAGAGIVSDMNFKGQVAKVCGIDPDPRVKSNPYLDEAHVQRAHSIPYADHTFDVVFSCNVMEHLENPKEVLKEVKRILKPGGVFLFKTPNAQHYMPLIARLTPTPFHKFYNKLRGREYIDTFPTFYRCNTKRGIQRYAADIGYDVHTVDLLEGRPEYLRISFLTYLIGLGYERLVNSTQLFKSFRILMVATLTARTDG